MTKYVLTLAEKQMRDNAETHVKIKNDLRRVSDKAKDKWAIITLSKIKNELDNGDSLYINTHGWCKSEKDRSGKYQVVATDRVDQSTIVKSVDAKAFHEFIASHLPKDKKFKLKVFACYSSGSTYEKQMGYLNCNFFAGQFASLLIKSHPLILVYGYRDETSLSATREFPHQKAGMVPLIDEKGNIKQISPTAEPKRASEHRVIYDLGRDVGEYNWERWI